MVILDKCALSRIELSLMVAVPSDQLNDVQVFVQLDSAFLELQIVFAIRTRELLMRSEGVAANDMF